MLASKWFITFFFRIDQNRTAIVHIIHCIFIANSENSIRYFCYFLRSSYNWYKKSVTVHHSLVTRANVCGSWLHGVSSHTLFGLICFSPNMEKNEHQRLSLSQKGTDFPCYRSELQVDYLSVRKLQSLWPAFVIEMETFYGTCLGDTHGKEMELNSLMQMQLTRLLEMALNKFGISVTGFIHSIQHI